MSARTIAVNNVIALTITILFTGCQGSHAETKPPAATTTNPLTSSVYRPDLEYLKALNAAGPAGNNPQIILILASQYLNANQAEAGIQFFETLLDRYDSHLPPRLKSVYLAGLGLLRAVQTNNLSLLSKPAWVKKTIGILEEAKQLSDAQLFIVRWASGIVYARLPGLFGKRADAIRDLEWARDHIDQAPHRGWLREIYFHLALAYQAEGNDAQAHAFLAQSGYTSYDKPTTVTTLATVNAQDGFRFSQPTLQEVIPDTVFTLSGFDFAELHFVISADRQNLVAIDMGTTPKSAQAAYEYLRRQKPNLPNLTTVFVTHSHWDHIGGHAYFRQLNPELIMVTRDNYAEELTRVVNTPRGFGYFFGADFAPDDVSGFKSDRLIADSQTITVGGTAFDLIPIQGGETEDAMLIHLPKYSTVFVGDFIMPYIGAPFIEEGNVEGLLDALDVVGNLKAQHILHGHGPLTALFGSAEMLVELRAHLAWLQDAVLKSLRQEGLSRPALHHLNLMPPNLTKTPLTQLPFLVLRENLINRLYDQQTGYWQTNLDGIDHLSDRELGALIVRYLGVSAVKLQKAVETMHQNGDYELAARALRWTHSQFPDHEALEPLKLKTYRKLQERFQQLNPFKFILYSEIIRDETPPIR